MIQLRRLYFPITALVLLFCACSCHTSQKSTEPQEKRPTMIADPSADTGRTGMRRELNARVYRTNGDYNDKVFILLGKDGSILYKPEPRTIDQWSAPKPLSNGYLLDMSGINQYAKFLTWTYDEYSKLSDTPSDSEIYTHIIPDSKVTEILQLPIGVRFGRRHPERCDSIILNGLDNCVILFERK